MIIETLGVEGSFQKWKYGGEEKRTGRSRTRFWGIYTYKLSAGRGTFYSPDEYLPRPYCVPGTIIYSSEKYRHFPQGADILVQIGQVDKNHK